MKDNIADSEQAIKAKEKTIQNLKKEISKRQNELEEKKRRVADL